MATSEPTTPAEYIAELPDDRRQAVEAVRAVFRERLPAGHTSRLCRRPLKV